MNKIIQYVVMCMFTAGSSVSVVFGQAKAAGGVDTSKYTAENCINRFSMAKIESTKVGYQYWFADKNFSEGKTLKLSVVGPHQATHPPHAHLEDEFFFVLEGNAELYFDGIWIPAEPYTSYYCVSHKEHGIRNAGDTELKYLVIKKYEKNNPIWNEPEKKSNQDH